MLRNLILAIVLIAISIPSVILAAFEHESIFKADMDSPILDVTTNPAGDLIFVLTPGAVLIYSDSDKVILDRIPLDNQYDRIIYQNDDRLVVTSTDPALINIISFNRIYDIDLSGREVRGSKEAKVTLAVFDDYQWPYCARLERYVQQLLDQFPEDLNYVVKHFPLPNHKFAYKGAMAALAAAKQGKFWEFHSQLLENYKQLNDEKITEIAGTVGLNIEQFNIDLESGDSRKLIQEDIQNGKEIGVRGTPSVFLNGKRIDNKDLGKLTDLIKRELKKDSNASSKKQK